MILGVTWAIIGLGMTLRVCSEKRNVVPLSRERLKEWVPGA